MMTNSNKIPAKLVYVYDPMCSWCWGVAPTWQKLVQYLSQKNFELKHTSASLEQAGDAINRSPDASDKPASLATHQIDMKVGGLAPDSDEPMPQEMQRFLQQTWRKISSQLGTEFNFDFWKKCQPRRSTYPACRAAIIARRFNKEPQMLAGIQQAYYLSARNPSNIDVLQAIAKEIGIDEQEFSQQMASQDVQTQLEKEIQYSRSLPISGFPSLVLKLGEQYHAIQVDYLDWQKIAEQIETLIKIYEGQSSSLNQ